MNVNEAAELKQPTHTTLWPAGVALAVTLVTMGWASYDMVQGQSMVVPLAFTLLIDLAMVAAWSAGVWGWGALIHRVTLGESHRCIASRLALGVGLMMVLVWSAGCLGVLNIFTAWALVLVGLGIAVYRVRGKTLGAPRISWALGLCAPAAALLVVASTVAPGMLWRIPMPDGQKTRNVLVAYDVLSYHLQLPREWFGLGAIRGLEHNVYSYLPCGLEAIFTQLMFMRADATAAATTCQLLHAGLALLAAGCLGQLTRILAERGGIKPNVATIAGVGTAALYLAVPWTLATGSMAFNEQAANALGAAALLVVLHPGKPRPMGRGMAAGWLVATAAMAKLTAIGMWGLPVAFVLVWGAHIGRKKTLLGFAIGGIIPLGLFMLRNWLWTGNPIFPIATGMLGTAHWSTEQASRWQQVHSPWYTPAERLDRFVTMGLTHSFYAYIIWPAALLGAIATISARRFRRIGVTVLVACLLQILFWFGPTHLQSRFLIPALATACVLIGLGTAQWRKTGMVFIFMIGMVGTVSWQGIEAYHAQWQGRAASFIGQTEQVGQYLPPWGPVNQLSGEVRIYAEGFAQPFYVNQPITYHTVWDTSPLGELIEAHGVRGAIDKLRDQGYTHLLIDYQMLGLWWSEGNYGYDSRFGPEQLAAIERLGLKVAFTDPPPTCVLYELASPAEH